VIEILNGGKRKLLRKEKKILTVRILKSGRLSYNMLLKSKEKLIQEKQKKQQDVELKVTLHIQEKQQNKQHVRT
jgi:hypothetical protein